MADHHHHHHHHYHDQDRGPDGKPRSNLRRLYRSRNNRVLCGVCGGIAEYFDWRPGYVRIGTVVLFFLPGFGQAVFIGYIVACFILKKAPAGPAYSYQSQEDERFWKNVSVKPSKSFSELRHRFRRIDGRVADMEQAVITEEYRLNKAFKDIE